ncbi:hypothetical protein ACP4OV_006885 [Aristida adscensionis]
MRRRSGKITVFAKLAAITIHHTLSIYATPFLHCSTHQEAQPRTMQTPPPMSSLVAVVVLLLSAASPAHGQPAAAAAADAPAPAPAPPKTITAVLTKAGQFTKFLQLLRSTQEADQINNQIKGRSFTGGFTVFAPPDNAFAALPAGALNALSDQQKTSLVQFHVVSQLLPSDQLDTVSNPVRTQAGDTRAGKYPLNVTSEAGHLNVSTGVVNATVDGTLYAGDRLVVYQVSKVLLPWALYGPPLPPSPAPAPAPAEARKKKKAGPEAVADAPAGDAAASGATRGTRGAGAGACVAAVVAAMWWGM